jgi:dinuclear metal center YbgI/SA1388 family protein
MVKRDKIIKFIFDYFGEEFLAKAKTKDSYVNGIQIRGSEKVKKIALGVGVNVKFLEKCRSWRANFVIVHHGISFDKLNHYINPIMKKRLKILFDNDMTLAGFHYLLDAHREIGNNAQILKRIGAKIIEPFYDEWGWIGSFSKPRNMSEVVSNLEKVFNHKAVKFLFGKKKIKKIAVTSGGGTPRLYEMPQFLEKNIDVYVTGEAKESTPSLFEEVGINYLAFGHYDTEKFGVQALGEVIGKKFPDVRVKFIDVPNPF